jgi:hypothetical protein
MTIIPCTSDCLIKLCLPLLSIFLANQASFSEKHVFTQQSLHIFFCSNGKLLFINPRWTMVGLLAMVSHVTFNNISVISWRSVLLMGNPEYFRPVASHWQTLSHNDGQASIYLKNIYILISKTWYRIEWALNCMIYQYNLYYIVFVVIGDHLFN